MRFVVAGGGVAGLATALAVARAGHSAVVLERDAIDPAIPSERAFDVARNGIPHFLQPHSFLPRGRRELLTLAPEVLDDLVEAGADPEDVARKLKGPREPADDELVYVWARRPLIEWALRRSAAAQAGVEVIAGATVAGLLRDGGNERRAIGVVTDDGDRIEGDLVVDALGRYRCPPGWPRAAGTPTDSGAIYYCRYFRLNDGVKHLDGPVLGPRGDLGYMGFNTFKGDNRSYAVILLAPAADRALKILREDSVWMQACAVMRPLDVMTSAEYGTPITAVLPMGGLMNVIRSGDPGVSGLVAVGDAFCHTDPAFAYGLSFSLAHASALGRAAREAPDADAVVERYRAEITAEAAERHALVCATDDARSRRWAGEQLDVAHRDGCYPLFSFAGAAAAATQDDEVRRRTLRRMGLLDRTGVFDEDSHLHSRIEDLLAQMGPPPPAGPPRDELLDRLRNTRPLEPA